MTVNETRPGTGTGTRAPRRFTRRTLFKGAGAAGLGLMVAPGLDFATAGQMRLVAAQSETVQDIINIAVTAEELAVTLLGGAVASAQAGKYNQPITGELLAILVAARAEEEFHRDYLKAAGAQPLTNTFNVPNTAILSDYTTLFQTILALETAFIAAYIAAAGEFTDLERPDLVKVAFQIAGVESEHGVLANAALGTVPANDIAFEAKLFASVGDAAAALTTDGFIGANPTTPVTYPGPGTIDSTGVSETSPGGPLVFCVPPGESLLDELRQFLQHLYSGGTSVFN